MKQVQGTGLLLSALLVFCLCAQASDHTSGLEVVEKTRSSEIRAAAGVDWESYTGFRVERATVAFRKNWARDLKTRSGIIIREADITRITETMVELVDEALVRELTAEGMSEATDGQVAGVLRLTPRVVDLDVIAPDRARDHIGTAFTDTQMRMVMELDLSGAASGELLATTRHRADDPYKGYMEWTTSPTNRRAARLALERWAGKIGDWLAERRNPGTD
jgi:hypothetical protein